MPSPTANREHVLVASPHLEAARVRGEGRRRGGRVRPVVTSHPRECLEKRGEKRGERRDAGGRAPELYVVEALDAEAVRQGVAPLEVAVAHELVPLRDGGGARHGVVVGLRGDVSVTRTTPRGVGVAEMPTSVISSAPRHHISLRCEFDVPTSRRVPPPVGRSTRRPG